MINSHTIANRKGWTTRKKRFSKEQISEMAKTAVMQTLRYKKANQKKGYKQDVNAE